MSVSQNPSGEFEATGIDAGEIENDLNEISEETGVPNYFDEVYVDDLEGDAVAATTLQPEYDIDEITGFDPYEDDWEDLDFENYEVIIQDEENLYGLTLEEFNTVFIADAQNYTQIDDKSRYLADLHEMMHGSQFNGNWGEDVQDAENISDEMRDYLNNVAEMSYEEFVEGNTELVTEAMVPNGKCIGQPFYPGLTEAAEDEMESYFDLEEEFDHYEQDDFLGEDYSVKISNPVTDYVDNLMDNMSGAGA
jgi:hypothetical protein